MLVREPLKTDMPPGFTRYLTNVWMVLAASRDMVLAE